MPPSDICRMLTQGQTRFSVLACLILIAVLLVLNLKFKAIDNFISSPSIFTKKDDTSIVTMHGNEEKTLKKDGKPLVILKDEQEDTLNKDLKQLRRKGFVETLKDFDLNKLSTEEILLTIHSYTDNTDIICGRKLRMGNIGDGGWEICDDVDVRPRRPCIVYSFGINYDFSFDDDVATVYGCNVYCFDPSMAKFADKVDRSSLVHFYKIGLSDKSTTTSSNWKLETLANIRALLGHKNTTIDVLKIDIESSEWQAIPEMVKSGQLKDIGQLMIEFHVTADSREYLLPRLQAIQAIEMAGYKRYYVHKNPACGKRITGYPIIRTQCYEVHYIRR